MTYVSHALGVVCVYFVTNSKKPEVRDERLRWEEALELLKLQQEKMLKGLSGQTAEMERSLKVLREKLMTFNQMYEDLITRKETKLYVETMNDKVSGL